MQVGVQKHFAMNAKTVITLLAHEVQPYREFFFNLESYCFNQMLICCQTSRDEIDFSLTSGKKLSCI